MGKSTFDSSCETMVTITLHDMKEDSLQCHEASLDSIVAIPLVSMRKENFVININHNYCAYTNNNNEVKEEFEVKSEFEIKSESDEIEIFDETNEQNIIIELYFSGDGKIGDKVQRSGTKISRDIKFKNDGDEIKGRVKRSKRKIALDKKLKKVTGKRRKCYTTFYSDSLPRKKFYQCRYPHCNKFMRSHSAIKYHEETHSVVNTFTCDVCSKAFACRAQLVQHIKIHNKIFCCGTCDRLFETKFLLSRHIQERHTFTLKYQCSKCDKKFVKYRDFRIHKFSHEASKPFKCDVCQITFWRKQHLSSHMRQHSFQNSDYSMFHCLECSSLISFRTHNSLGRHYKEIHPLINIPCKSVSVLYIFPDIDMDMQTETIEAVEALQCLSQGDIGV